MVIQKDGILKILWLCISINAKTPSKFYLAAGNNDKSLIDQLINSEIGKNCESFQNLKIKDTLPIIKNCNLYVGNDTGSVTHFFSIEYKMFSIVYG